jgi:hypothetical protein
MDENIEQEFRHLCNFGSNSCYLNAINCSNAAWQRDYKSSPSKQQRGFIDGLLVTGKQQKDTSRIAVNARILFPEGLHRSPYLCCPDANWTMPTASPQYLKQRWSILLASPRRHFSTLVNLLNWSAKHGMRMAGRNFRNYIIVCVTKEIVAKRW